MCLVFLISTTLLLSLLCAKLGVCSQRNWSPTERTNLVVNLRATVCGRIHDGNSNAAINCKRNSKESLRSRTDEHNHNAQESTTSRLTAFQWRSAVPKRVHESNSAHFGNSLFAQTIEQITELKLRNAAKRMQQNAFSIADPIASGIGQSQRGRVSVLPMDKMVLNFESALAVTRIFAEARRCKLHLGFTDWNQELNRACIRQRMDHWMGTPKRVQMLRRFMADFLFPVNAEMREIVVVTDNCPQFAEAVLDECRLLQFCNAATGTRLKLRVLNRDSVASEMTSNLFWVAMNSLSVAVRSNGFVFASKLFTECTEHCNVLLVSDTLDTLERDALDSGHTAVGQTRVFHIGSTTGGLRTEMQTLIREDFF